MATTGDEQIDSGKERQGNKRRGGAVKARGEETPRLSTAVSDARQSLQVMAEDWRDLVDEHPMRALGLALGAGYVIGGGLLTPLTGRLLLGALRLGFRLAAFPLVRDELMSVLETATERVRGETERRHQ